ncbi:MAG: SNF2-related protein, partial [Candidatus Kariarchaeaceae archaeon]
MQLRHQRIGTQAIVKNPFFGLFDKMGLGKTKQCIDAAHILFNTCIINKVIVVCPAAVRGVWFDEEFGQLAEWNETPSRIIEYHIKNRMWENSKEDDKLLWIITNYEFIRTDYTNGKPRLMPLLDFADEQTLLILDESSMVKNWGKKQTRACRDLRRKCGRVVLLNGTPITNSPNDMFAQGQLMHTDILQCNSYYHFRARYAVMGGWKRKEIIDWQNLDDLQKRFKPYVLARGKEECPDLPPKLDPIVYSVPLRHKTWEIYKEMKNEMIAWLSEQKVSLAPQAIVRAMRLAQITSGLLGGVEEDGSKLQEPIYIGEEKLSFFNSWLEKTFNEDPNLKILIWCRWVKELQRVMLSLGHNENIISGAITGGQSGAERERAINLLGPRSAPKGPVVVVGNPQAGGMGLNLTASHTVMYLSNDYSLKNRLQSMDRVHRQGQTYPVSYFDVVATGPNGQKTIDHLILKKHKKKEALANMTTKAWIEE